MEVKQNQNFQKNPKDSLVFKKTLVHREPHAQKGVRKSM